MPLKQNRPRIEFRGRFFISVNLELIFSFLVNKKSHPFQNGFL